MSVRFRSISRSSDDEDEEIVVARGRVKSARGC
jgi:hypothetical protein